jgi:predicted nucleic acid-binding protein
MIVVADTSPLNYLIRAELAWVLPRLFGRILIPNAVLNEMLHDSAPDTVRRFAADPPAWLESVTVTTEIGGLQSSLGEGERQAISLAFEEKADALLIDDREGRKAAKARNIPTRGTLAVLLQAGLRGLVDFPRAMDDITALGFRISDPLRRELLAEYETRRNG